MFIIADDITGAAEMAGIAHRLGFSAHLQLCSPSSNTHHLSPNTQQLLVLATDTRGINEEEAVAETKRITTNLLSPSLTGRDGVGLWGGAPTLPTVLYSSQSFRR